MTDSDGSRPTFVDMAPLMGRLEEWLAVRCGRVHEVTVGAFDRQAFAERVGYWPAGRPHPEVIVGADVALDLGHPRTASESAVLLTNRPAPVCPRRVRWLGPDLPELPNRAERAFAQLVLLRCAAAAPPDPFAVEAAQYLTHRLDGYMVRSIPGRLWVRVSRAARARGLDFETVGRALIATYETDFPAVEAVEILFVTSGVEDVRALGSITTEARVMAGRHKKLALGTDGQLECSDLDCDSCEEQEVCDSLRDVVIKRRRRRAEALCP